VTEIIGSNLNQHSYRVGYVRDRWWWQKWTQGEGEARDAVAEKR